MNLLGSYRSAFAVDLSIHMGRYYSIQWPHFQPQHSYEATKSQIPYYPIDFIRYRWLFIVILTFEILLLYIYRNWELNILGEN